MNVQPFDVAQSPLDGVNLIEASAGTGKTYTIAGLYLRLILEKHLTVENILVVTFTEAATQELKERIRRRLKEASICFEHGHSGDPLLDACLNRSVDRVEDLERLRESVRSFDQAAVFTIHGFCQRMLVENAFESGALFETELVTDTRTLVSEILQDFIRIKMYGMTSFFADYLYEKGTDPESLGTFISKVMKPGMRFAYRPEYRDTAEKEQSFFEAFARLKHLWNDESPNLLRLLMKNAQLNQRTYSEKAVNDWAKTTGRYLNDSRPGSFAIPEHFSKGCATTIAAAVKKGCTAPEHPFFEMCDTYCGLHRDLAADYKSNEIDFKLKALAYVESQLERRKREKGILFFDDLLTRLYGKLKQEPDGLLSRRIRSSYAAALIDEFQDTDPVQYTIFSQVFARGSGPLFMIGDPKQAIYGFRGADIFAYLRAVENAGSRYTLGKNYRSDPGLVRAVNTLFENVKDPFVFSDIAFHPADADEKDPPEHLTVDSGDDRDTVPLAFMLLRAGDKEMTKTEAGSLCRKAVASEMARLLRLAHEGKATLGGRALEPRDMAVLVRSNLEAKAMNETLKEFGIPSVIFDTGNVFQSPEAAELEKVLGAVLQPGRTGLVKAALATDMMGAAASDLFLAEREEGTLDLWYDMFRNWQRLWNRRGVSAMLNAFIKDRAVKPRLMEYKDGPRRNTNLAHLAQLLHQADMEFKTGPLRLLAWFRERIQNPEENEEHQLRLEQDEKAVTIVTIHKSKGMEYPVVFLPYAWNHVDHKDGGVCVYHDEQDRHLSCDLGSENMDAHKAAAERENLAESLRVLYVALTRAKKKCYVVWGRVNAVTRTAMARLIYEGCDETPSLNSDSAMMEALNKVAETAGGLITVFDAETGSVSENRSLQSEIRTLSRSVFTGSIENDFRIVSFSALTAQRGLGAEAEAMDRDREPLNLERMEERNRGTDRSNPDFMDFPRGAAPGTFLHGIFEHTDFTWDDDRISNLVSGHIGRYGYGEHWIRPVSRMVRDVLDNRMMPDDSGFTLSSIRNQHRRNEMEFYYPLNRIEPGALENVFETYGRKRGNRSGQADTGGSRLDFQPVKGFMKGFVDLVFRRKIHGVDTYYILDWKSNFLGFSPEDYSPENLEMIMKNERYDLQYHLYSLALHRFLGMKLGATYDYSTHFGGVFYVFLRGVKPEYPDGYGIFRDRPDPDLISGLSHLFWGS